jgi:hypothetical protein
MLKEIKMSHPFRLPSLSSGQRSWVDAVHDGVDQLKINRWLFYLIIAVAMVMLLHGLHWMSGALAFGQFTGPLIFTAIVTVMSIAFAHYLDLVAVRCLQRFRSALCVDDAEIQRLSAHLTTMPAVAVWVSHLISIPLLVSILRFDPTFYGLFRGYSLSDLPLYAFGLLYNGILIVDLYHTIHQLSWVQRIHARAQSISVIDRSPAFAFSTLTYWTAVLGMVLVYGFIYFFPPLRRDPVAVSMAAGAVLLLIVTFFVPLQEMHDRLVDDKDRRLRAVRQQIEGVFTRLQNERAEADLAGVEQVGKHLNALMVEEEYLGKLPTWPWPAGTVTKLVSVAFLPLLLIIAERLLGQLIP